MKLDPTGINEQIGFALMEEQRHFINTVGPTLQNRPAFSEPKPKEVEHQEFVEARDAAMSGNPQPLMERLKMYEGVMGFEGRMDFLDWLNKHHEMVAEMPRNDVMEQDNARSIY